MNLELVERKAQALLNETKVNDFPISVEEVARKKNLVIRSFDFGEDVSGALIIEGDKGVIGYNPKDPKVRQRFTIAHEIGHYILHRPISNIFFDQTSNFSIQFRANSRISKDGLKEREANVFAAALLMPKNLVVEATRNRKVDLSDEKSLRELARLFDVSSTAMAIRITHLQLIR